MKRIASLMAAGLVLLAANVSRGQNFWEPANGALYGNVICLAFDSSGGIFAGTDYGGIFRSRDNGESWTDVSAGLLDNRKLPSGLSVPNSVWSIAAGPDGQIYASSNGLFRSTDEGVSWTKIDTDIYIDLLITPLNKLFGLKGCVGVWNESNHEWQTVLNGACNHLSLGPSGRLFVVDSGMLYSTTDNGVSWRVDTEGQFSYGPRGILDTIVVRHSNFTPSAIFFDSAGRLFTFSDGILIFDTVARTWSKYSLSSYYTYIYDRTGRFMAHLGQLFVTSDQGKTWVSLDSLQVNLITFAPSGDLYGTASPNGLERSTLDGSWINVEHGITDLLSETYSIAVTPNGNVIAALDQSVWQSSNQGSTWETIGSQLASNNFLSLCVSPKGRLLVGTYSGIYLSSDDGQTWLHSDSTLDNLEISELVPGINGEIFACASNYSSITYIFRSTDDGDHWSLIPSFVDSNLTTFAVAPNGHLFAGTVKQVYRSTNNGVSWEKIIGNSFGRIAISKSGTILIDTGNGLVISSDDGNSWIRIDFRHKFNYMGCFTMNQQGQIFASTDSGIFRSTNEGNTWNATGTGLENPIALTLACDSSGRIFAGDLNGGIFRSTQSTLDVNKENQVKLSDLILDKNSPNPFSQSTTISFTLPEPSYISLKLFDATGREVATLASGFFDVGAHDLPFARGTLPTGVYFYRLEAGGQSVTRAMVVE